MARKNWRSVERVSRRKGRAGVTRPRGPLALRPSSAHLPEQRVRERVPADASRLRANLSAGGSGRRKWSAPLMSGRARLPGGEPRKASQRSTRRAAPTTPRINPVWRAGDQVRWRDRTGTFRRHVGDGEHAEVMSGGRIYLVRVSELR